MYLRGVGFDSLLLYNIMEERMIMGKGKHNEWHKVSIHNRYVGDIRPTNKQTRQRIKNKINKEIKTILQERK